MLPARVQPAAAPVLVASVLFCDHRGDRHHLGGRHIRLWSIPMASAASEVVVQVVSRDGLSSLAGHGQPPAERWVALLLC